SYLEVLEGMAEQRGRYVPWNRLLPPILACGARNWLVRSGLGSVDVYHSLFSARPIDSRVCRIGTVHDLIPLRFPDLCPSVSFDKALNGHLRDSDFLIVPSEATKRDLVMLKNVDPERIHVVYHGIDSRQFHPDDRADARILNRHGLESGTYILYVGSIAK